MNRLDWFEVVVFTVVLILVVYLFWVDTGSADARAYRRPVPVEQFDQRTHLWTARAMVAESGWTAGNDQIAVAYVFSRRWKAMARRWPRLRFVDVVLRYSKGVGAERREHSARQIWIRGLSPTMLQPEGWPAQHASWKRHKGYWARTLDRALLWSQGRLRDPCRGKAQYFGGDMDEPELTLVPIECDDVRNIYYRLR